MTRSEIREHIFKLVFRREFNSADEMPGQLKIYFEDNYKVDTDSDTPEDDDRLCLFREDEEAALNAGMQAHIAKPIDVDILLQTLTSVLSQNK